MTELKKNTKEIAQKLGIEFSYYKESSKPTDAPVSQKTFEDVTDDGTYTFFRFTYKGVGYIGAIKGVTEIERNYAFLLPSYIEGFNERETELSKTEFLKKILLGECSSMSIYKYATKFSVRGALCFALVIRIPKMMDEAVSVLEQYGGNTLDTAVKMAGDTCVLVKFLDKSDNEYQSSVDYAEFLARLLKEELGLDVEIGVGPTVRELRDITLSYARAENALRYGDVFDMNEHVHSYRKFILVKLLEDIPKGKLNEYLTDVTDENFKEVLEDEEMLATAEEFLRCSLNVSETSRNLYMHRNTLLYRLDKLERAMGLNIRSFADAVSFRVLTIIYRLLGK